MSRHLRYLLPVIISAAVVTAANSSLVAQTIWSGFTASFTKADFADPTDSANQDRITSSVWITRSTNAGLFNIHDETSYSPPPPTGLGSPVGTRWATILNNPGKSIAATNWSNLAFTDWVTAYGGQGTMNLPARLLSNNAVVYLAANNIYLDLRFTAWSGAGGGFSYDRAQGTALPLLGDYNVNGSVDAADYVVWRKTLNQVASPAGSGADGNVSGIIDPGDYTVWRANFGNSQPAAGVANSLTSTAIPEPPAALLCLAWLFAHMRVRLRFLQNNGAKNRF